MRMVDADQLEKAVIGDGIFKDGWEFKTAWGIPVVDAEPVVRCKDCKYFVEIKAAGRTVRDCGRLSPYGFAVSRNDFCSFGRRKR